MKFKDCRGVPLVVGDMVGIAFASSGSSGRLQVGEIKSIQPFVVTWEDGVDSRRLAYRAERVVRLSL